MLKNVKKLGEEDKNRRKWLKSHHDTLFPFFPYLKKRDSRWLSKRIKGKGSEKGALYVHIPFCVGRCTFCILTKEPPRDMQRYVDSVLKEAKEWRDCFHVEAIYVGGGTPTLLSSEELRSLFEGLENTFSVAGDVEFTVETTVSELTEDKMNLLVDLGVNRISFGIQTFKPSLRKTFGRRSKSKEVIEKLNRAREIFPLLTIDLLYDLPGQSEHDVITDLQTAMGIGIDGISLYPLIYSPKTSIGRQFTQPQVEMALGIFRTAKRFLEDNGYHYLNINHFSNGRDNFLYSTYFNSLGNVLGLGAGAMGFLNHCFVKHKSTSAKYIRGIIGSVFNAPDNVIPVLWCVLQLQYGRIDIEESKRRWGFNPLVAFPGIIQRCIDRGEMIVRGNTIELTTEGMFWANTIGTEIAVEYLYNGKGKLIGLEDSKMSIASFLAKSFVRRRLQTIKER